MFSIPELFSSEAVIRNDHPYGRIKKFPAAITDRQYNLLVKICLKMCIQFIIHL